MCLAEVVACVCVCEVVRVCACVKVVRVCALEAIHVYVILKHKQRWRSAGPQDPTPWLLGRELPLD